MPSPSPSPNDASQTGRSAILQCIQFQGLIRGCRDYQWLIADALWDVGAGPTPEMPRRWVVTSPDPSLDPFGKSSAFSVSGPQFAAIPRLIARDRLTDWTASAASASGLAARIRQSYGAGPARSASTGGAWTA